MGAKAKVPVVIPDSRQTQGIWFCLMREEVSGAKALLFPHDQFDHRGCYLGRNIFRSIQIVSTNSTKSIGAAVKSFQDIAKRSDH
jgi:hypothetical protein